MDFLTAYYKENAARSVSLLLQQCRWRDGHVCFACLTAEGKAGSYMEEQLLYWFRGIGDRELTNLVKNENGAEKLSGEIKKTLLRAEEELRYSGMLGERQGLNVVGVLCVERVYIFFHRHRASREEEQQKQEQQKQEQQKQENGEVVKGYILNTFFGKTCMNRLGQSDVLVEWGILEKDVGILLATDSFYEKAGAEKLQEGLRLVTPQSAEGIKRNLAELGSLGECAGGCDVAAVLVRSVAESAEPQRLPVRCNRREPRYVQKGRHGIGHTVRNRNSKQSVKIVSGNRKADSSAVRINETSEGEKSRLTEEDMWQWKAKLRLHGCEMLGVLGQGSFARVYKVKNTETGQICTCKVSASKEMLQREYRVLKEIRHPLFPQVYEYWEEDAYGILCMEYISGETLQEKLKRRRRFASGQIVRIGMALADGLLCLHEGNLLFRDVKPENIMITQQGRVKLIDFGCVCEPGQSSKTKAGSPGFGAPEQFENKDIDVTADVYGVGRTLEALLGGAVENRRSGRPKRRGFGRSTCRRTEMYRKTVRYCHGHGEKKDLWRLVNVCTRTSAVERMPDMRTVLWELGNICAPNKGRRPWRERIYIKNIWLSAYKWT